MSTVLSYTANRATAKLLNTTTEEMLDASAKELLETVERTKDVHTALLELQGVAVWMAAHASVCVCVCASLCVCVRARWQRVL